MRRSAKIDGNQPRAVELLEARGWSVKSLAAVGDGCPDLLVGAMGLNILIEMKMPKGKLRPKQELFKARWKGQYAKAESPEDAVKMVELIIKANRLGVIRDSNGRERPHIPHDGKSYDEHQLDRCRLR